MTELPEEYKLNLEPPQPLPQLAEAIDRIHQINAINKPRPHMGCSEIGHPCDRWLWLKFRWAVNPEFNGRMLRLFQRGHDEEKKVVEDLRSVGCVIDSTGVMQRTAIFGADFGPTHLMGSADGVISSGLPGFEDVPHLLEIKTHNNDSFLALLKHGVKSQKPQHYVQMQMYMDAFRLEWALYAAVNKNNDSYYFERVRYNKQTADRYIERGLRLAHSERLPEPISTDPTWYQCKFCDGHAFCHKKEPLKQRNCRTCFHATPKPDGTFHCENFDDRIPTAAQYDGCDEWIMHPDLEVENR